MSNFPLWVTATSGAVGAVNIAGVINGVSSTTLSLTVAKRIAGVINGVSSTTLILTSGKSISGTINGVSLTTCAISKDVFLVGTINGVSSTTLSLTVAKGIAGVINGVSSTTLALTTTKRISGVINGVSSTTLSLTVAKSISGVINGVSSTTCAISIGVVNIAGIINGVSSTVCAISVNKWDAVLTESSPDLSPTFGGLIVGTPANHTQFESDGSPVLVGTAAIVHAEIYVQDNATLTTISSSGKANKVQIVIFNTDGSSKNMTPDHTNDHITVVKAGMYLATVSITVSGAGGDSDNFGFSMWKNNGNAEFVNVHGHRKLSGGAGDIGSIHLSGIVDLAVNDTIEMWMWNEDDMDNATVDDITLSLIQIGGT